MLLKPLVGVEEEELLAPQHPGERLPHDIGRVFAHAGWRDRLIERISLATPLLNDLDRTGCQRDHPIGSVLSRSRMTVVSPAPTSHR